MDNLSANEAYIVSYHDAIRLDDHHILAEPYSKMKV